FEGGFRGARQRVGDDEAGSATVGRGDRDLSAHAGGELADDGQTEPRTPGRDDGVTPSTEEPAEDLLALGHGDAWTLVVDHELDAVAVLLDRDPDGRPGGG